MTKARNKLGSLVSLSNQKPSKLVVEEPVNSVESPSGSNNKRPSREGKRLIGGHFEPEVSKQLKLLAIELDTSVQECLREALNDYFIKKQKSPIA